MGDEEDSRISPGIESNAVDSHFSYGVRTSGMPFAVPDYSRCWYTVPV